MNRYSIYGLSRPHQYLMAVAALPLLVTVSVLALLPDPRPLLTAAILSALAWNFLFSPPKFTFAIQTAEHALMFMMYFVVVPVNAVFTTRIRAASPESANSADPSLTCPRAMTSCLKPF